MSICVSVCARTNFLSKIPELCVGTLVDCSMRKRPAEKKTSTLPLQNILLNDRLSLNSKPAF